MCPNTTQYRYTPHKLLTDHPRLFFAKCYRLMSYIVDHTPYCFDCYQSFNETAEFTMTLQHLLLDGPTLRGQPCHKCRQSIFKTRNAISCDDCFQSYMYIADKTPETGNHPRNITGFLYNVFKAQLLRLFVVENSEL